jgi:DNA-binding response OmpR family regulator
MGRNFKAMTKEEILIIIIDDEKQVAETIRQMVQAISPDIKALTFYGAEVLEDSRIFDAALFIIDLHLQDIEGRQLAMKLPKICRASPFLFISGYPFEDNKIIDSASFLTVDFISKPIRFALLKNRIKILLAVSGECRRVMFGYDLEKKKVEHYAFLPFVALVLDEDLKIHYANKQLRRLVGAGADQKLYDMDWLNFIPEPMHQTVKEFHRYIFKSLDLVDQEYLECNYEILTASGQSRVMVWGNTIFQGRPEPDEKKMVLSIATTEAELSPLMRKKRSYWENQIYMHRAAIKDFRRKMMAEKRETEQIEVCRVEPAIQQKGLQKGGPA